MLHLLGILDFTIVNTKAKALISPIHYPEAHMMCLLTLSHLLMLRQKCQWICYNFVRMSFVIQLIRHRK